MATKKPDWSKLIEEKLVEVKGSIAVLKTGGKEKSTQLYQKRREARTLILISHLLSGEGMTADDQEHLVSLTTLVEERARVVFELQIGDTVMNIMNRYPNKKNLLKAVHEYCAKHGLMLDEKTLTIVKDPSKEEVRK